MATKRKAEPGTAGSAYRTMPLSCVQCGNTKTPQWREGPLGPKTLCNACGVKWLRQLKRVREEAAPTKVHGTRRVRLSPSSHRASSREPPTRSGMYLHGDSSDDAVWPADEEDEMAAASLLTFAGVAPPLPMHTAMEDDEQGGEDLHMHAAAGTGALAQPTGSLATNENDCAITFHLPIPKLEVQRAAAPHAPPPPHGAQLIITRRVAVRKPLVYAPLPSSFHVLSTTTAAHGADPAAEDHEDEHSELADENNNTNLVVQYEAAHQGQPANSRDSHQDVAPQQLAQPLATPAAARAPPTTEAVSAGPDASQLAELQAAVIAAFAELQAADAARIATLQYLAQTQEAADNARQQALECAERLLAELEGLNACQSGRKQPAVAAAVAANVTATAAASAPANLMAHAMAAALGHAASPMPLTGH